MHIPMMTVRIENCRFYGRHGVLPQEREAGNEFEVTIEVDYNVIPYSDNFNTDSNQDDLSTTISYADLYDIAKKEMQTPRRLLETIAKSISVKIGEKFPQALVARITLRKMTPPIPGITGSAGITYTHPYPR